MLQLAKPLKNITTDIMFCEFLIVSDLKLSRDGAFVPTQGEGKYRVGLYGDRKKKGNPHLLQAFDYFFGGSMCTVSTIKWQ